MKVLITGGAGFIGANLARRHIERGNDLIVLDNLSRKGAGHNLSWLRERGAFVWIQADVRDPSAMKTLLRDHPDLDLVVHLAAQPAVTTSLVNPVLDFETNALGTLNLLEAIRVSKTHPIVLFSSTNKVYGDLGDLPVVETPERYRWTNGLNAIDERRNLDFRSPYGCSKGAADQYVLDYARIYGLRAVVLRQSCIYGENQYGVEDQGWVAWLSIAAMMGWPIRVFGTGKQVRDLLYIDDLLDAFDGCVTHIDRCAGQAFNVGGGRANTLSLLELFAAFENWIEHPPCPEYAPLRQGDQTIFVADNRKLTGATGWAPTTSVTAGLERLWRWLEDQRETISELHGSSP